ncbi:signal peptidase I [Dethiothermospora halolimnae]|uniref:signal peptidase I n=1 Tax=Dethiothermospora halolimnae TaxID=3114390 RepID=UPI003CCBE809
MKKKEIFEWLKSIAIAVIIAVIIKAFVFNTTYVLGYSMYPTLHDKDRLFTNKIGYRFGEPDRGDIVVLKAPDDPEKDYIKRVIGIAGDRVEIYDGKVYLNGKILKEDYLTGDTYTNTYGRSHWKIPDGHVFVLGDNRSKGASKDSRHLGFIPVSSIKGKAIFRYFPFNDDFGNLYK